MSTARIEPKAYEGVSNNQNAERLLTDHEKKVVGRALAIFIFRRELNIAEFNKSFRATQECNDGVMKRLPPTEGLMFRGLFPMVLEAKKNMDADNKYYIESNKKEKVLNLYTSEVKDGCVEKWTALAKDKPKIYEPLIVSKKIEADIRSLFFVSEEKAKDSILHNICCALLENGFVEESIEKALLISNESIKEWRLLDIFDYQLKNYGPEKAAPTIDLMNELKDTAYSRLAKEQAHQGNFKDAIETACKIEEDRDRTITEISTPIIRKDVDLALSLVPLYSRRTPIAFLLQNISEYLKMKGNPIRARQVAEMIPVEWIKKQTLAGY